MPYLCQWAEADALAGLDPEVRNEIELAWFLTKAELATLADQYLALRAQDNPDFGLSTYEELSDEQQAAMAEGLAHLFTAQMRIQPPDQSLLTKLWDQLDLE